MYNKIYNMAFVRSRFVSSLSWRI